MDDYNYDRIREQILSVRDSGVCNMLDVPAVQRAANDNGFYDLVIYIEENKSGYSNFLFHGEFK